MRKVKCVAGRPLKGAGNFDETRPDQAGRVLYFEKRDTGGRASLSSRHFYRAKIFTCCTARIGKNKRQGGEGVGL